MRPQLSSHPLQAVALIMLATMTVAVGSASNAAPSNLERSLDRTTDKGVFRVKVASAANPIPMNLIHRWNIRLTTPDGTPVTGATIAVDGGMPEHGHGLPTAPRVVAGAEAGQYRIEGMKFSMDGWWELKLRVNAAGRTDAITFNIML